MLSDDNENDFFSCFIYYLYRNAIAVQFSSIFNHGVTEIK